MDEPLPQRETTLADYWQVLVRRRSIVLGFFLICTATVTIGTFLMTPLYRGETKIVIEGESTEIERVGESSAASMAFDIFENYLETQMAIMKSDSVAGKVYSEFKLNETPRYRRRQGLSAIFKSHFINDINLERLKGTRMILISVDNPDPKLAADLANRLAEVYAQDNLKRRALTFIRNQRMASLNADFLSLQSKLDALSNQFGPKHPQMIALREEIRSMTKRIQNERFAGLESSANVKTSEDQALLENTLLQVQESSVLSSSKMNNIGIIDRAGVPEKVAKPKKALNILLGVFFGFVGGILLAFLIDYLDDTVKTDEDVKKSTGGRVFLGSLLSEQLATNSASQEYNIDCLTQERATTASAEAYRLVRTRMQWSAPKDAPFKDFAVVSSVPSEGKTIVASNLAIVLSQLKKRVLLVDSDMRKGRIHLSYGLTNDKGLGQYLTEGHGLDKVVQKTRVTDLFIVTSGKSAIDSSQLFSSARMEEFIRETRSRFDIIVYDTPPLMVISDAIILAPRLGGVLLVTRCGVTSSRVLQKTLSLIKESQINVLGTVLNDSKSNDALAYSSYYHAYQKRPA